MENPPEKNTFIDSTPVPDECMGCCDNYDFSNWNDPEPPEEEECDTNPCETVCTAQCEDTTQCPVQNTENAAYEDQIVQIENASYEDQIVHITVD